MGPLAIAKTVMTVLGAKALVCCCKKGNAIECRLPPKTVMGGVVSFRGKSLCQGEEALGANDVTCISTFFSNGGFLVAKVADIFWQSIDRSRGKVSLCVYRPLTDWERDD